MAARFKSFDGESPYLLPPSLQDWLPEEHIAHFIIDAVGLLPMSEFHVNHNGNGSEQFHPHVMCSLLIYCYATGRFSSRSIESATYSDVAVRFIAANEHPDHDTICKFRRDNGKAFKSAFIRVLELATELGALKKLGGISIDGTKIKANASKHSAVSYKKAEELMGRLSNEIEQLLEKAEAADSKPLEEGLSIPDEIARRQDRIGSRSLKPLDKLSKSVMPKISKSNSRNTKRNRKNVICCGSRERSLRARIQSLHRPRRRIKHR